MSLASIPSSDPGTATSPQISDPRLLAAIRIVWIMLAVLGLLHVFTFLSLLSEQYRSPPEELAQLGITPEAFVGYFTILTLLSMVVFYGVSALLMWRRHDRFGMLVALFLIALGTSPVDTYGPIQFSFSETILADHPVLWLTLPVLGTVAWGGFMLFAVFFPDGRIVPRRARYLVVYYLVIALVSNLTLPDSPLFPFNWPPLLFFVMFITLLGSMVYVPVYRYRRVSSPSQRQQTKWVVYGFVLILFFVFPNLVLFPALQTQTVSGTASILAYLYLGLAGFSLVLLPVTISFAILRYRLFDIDLVINRSLVYGAVTLLALLIFFGATLALQVVGGEQQPLVALIIAAVVSAALFNPVRRRAQHFVDRRLYRFRFDLNELAEAQRLPEVQNPGALTGQTLGAYQILDVLGKGGMGEVYKGYADGQTAAIKILPADLALQKEFQTRFEREAQALTSLDHPNIVKTYGSGESDGVYYLAMEFIDGEELSIRIKQQGALPVDDVRDIVNCLGSALDYAHSQGLVHRDIKPSNVMLRLADDKERWQAILMDFGVAKVQDARTAITGTGAIGTIDYMAPEQITEAKAVDLRADVYALGLVLFEMLTGERPFKGSGVGQVLFAHLQQPAPDPRDLVPDLPRNVAKAILKALEKQPDARYQSAGELAAAISTAIT